MSIVIEATNAVAGAAAAPLPPSGLSAPMATVLAAAIGAAVALVVLLLKEVVIERLREDRAAHRSGRNIYRQYLAPLADACEKIVWRASEIFVDKRHSFLKTATLPLEFNTYKRRSTLFRIATFIGWIRAMSLELAAIPRTGKAYSSPISKDVAAFQKALADGPHVERQRLERMCEMWKIDLSGHDEGTRQRLAASFEVELHAAVGSQQRVDDAALASLERKDQVRICKQLADYLCRRLDQRLIARATVEKTVVQAIRGLTYREALIYRDWQDALGDAMLTPDPDSPRRYKTIGYDAFDALLDNSTTPWMKVFATSIDNIDFDDIDPNDFRASQLKAVVAAVASVLISIAESEHRDLVSKNTLGAAKALRKAVQPEMQGE